MNTCQLNHVVPVSLEKTNAPIRVLHVDDDEGFLSVSKEILSSDANMEVDTASSVDEALRRIQTCAYTAIISDYEMPQKDGLQFLREIRSQGILTPFVLFTGKGREEVAIEALNLGADGYINKQGSPETVYGELAHTIARSVALRQVEDRYRMIAENIQDVVTVVDESGIFVFVSPSVEKVAGYSPKELIGQRCIGLFHPEDWIKIMIPAVQKLREGQEVPPTEYRIRTKNGPFLWVEGNAHSIIDEQGRIKLLVVSRNIEERKKVEEKLWHLAERNYLYLETGGVGTSEYDFQTRKSFWDEHARVMLGVKEGATPKFEENLFEIHPEDRKDLTQAIQQAIAGANKERYRSEFRVLLNDNSIRWVASYGQVYFKGEGENRKPSRLLGVYVDVTERKKAERS